MRHDVSAPTAGAHDLVTIKGIRNGLLFLLSDEAEFGDVLADLESKLKTDERTDNLTTAMMVYFDVGDRQIDEAEVDQIRELFPEDGHLVVCGFEGAPPIAHEFSKEPYVYKGTVRSGKMIEHDGDVIVIGDVNPGAEIVASGDIFVMGHLRGFAHAGATGDRRAVVAAVYFDPLQVRIANVARRSPESSSAPAEMEFAYLDGEQMAVERMSALVQHRARHRLSRLVV